MNYGNLDRWITGENDPNAPFNQPDPEQDNSTVEEFIEDKNTLGAILRIQEIRCDIEILRSYARNTDNTYLLKKLTKIYNQL